MTILPFKKILCPTDFSEPSLLALDAASELARHFGAELWVLHAVALAPPLPLTALLVPADVPSDNERCDQARQQVNTIIQQRVAPTLQVQGVVKMGYAADEITAFAADQGVGLIVIATHGLTGWRHLVFGSVAEAVVRSAPCPVLTIQVKPASEAMLAENAIAESVR